MFRKLSIVALIIGCIIPDFVMFIPISSYDVSHSIVGLIMYCLPMGLIVYLFFVHFSAALIIDTAPSWLSKRVYKCHDFNFKYSIVSLILISTSLILGATTHILWDVFSHQNTWLTQLIPILNKNIPILNKNITIFNLSIEYYKLIQYMSSLIGLPVLIIYSYIILKRIKPKIMITKNNQFSLRVMILIYFLLIIIFTLIHLTGEYTGKKLLGMI
ncbi:MAG: DUF4184 family protein, partial [Pseudomonadales bacterium]|nr:DUF4184 family protein [Pseudomonadales bacterium]